jgi:8-oxo-dGTP pyrophosphatase MutT (NUDIX family)
MMEEIIINKGRLKNDEITEVIDKARIILRNKKTKEIILTRFNRVYFLPGGKIEDKEKVLNTIIREVKEETNIDVTLDSDEPFIKVKHYLRDYVLPDNTVNNRLVNTYYFTGYTDSEDIEYFNLTKLEKHDNLRAFFISKEEAVELLTGYNKENRKAEYLALETLKVLENYKK